MLENHCGTTETRELSLITSYAANDTVVDSVNVTLSGAMISLTVLSFNFAGDGLRDALDPRLGTE